MAFQKRLSGFSQLACQRPAMLLDKIKRIPAGPFCLASSRSYIDNIVLPGRKPEIRHGNGAKFAIGDAVRINSENGFQVVF